MLARWSSRSELVDVRDQSGNTELQVYDALRRRGLALQFADICTYITHDRHLTELFGHLHRVPPPGYARCTLAQMLRADRAVFQHLVDNGVQVGRLPDGTQEIDGKLIKALHSYDVSFCLMPLPEIANKAPASTESTKPNRNQTRPSPYQSRHICAKRGCFAPHSARERDSKKKH